MFCSYQKQKWGIFYTILSKLHLKKTVNRSIEHTHLQMNKKELLLLKNCSVLRRMYFLWYFFSSLLYKFHKRFLFFISCAVFIKLSRCTSPSICTIQCIHGDYDDWCYPFYITSFAQFFFVASSSSTNYKLSAVQIDICTILFCVYLARIKNTRILLFDYICFFLSKMTKMSIQIELLFINLELFAFCHYTYT